MVLLARLRESYHRERLNQADPHAGVARAERWLADETGGEGQARALRSLAYALRVAGQYERCEPCFTAAEQAFSGLGLEDDAVRRAGG